MNKRLLIYFNEFSAIPTDVRQRFYNSRLKSIDSANRKYLILFRIIEKFISGREFGQVWDNQKVCKILNINISMLRCHRSRLLKQLREFYFDFKISGKVNSVDKAFEYLNHSMIREAKSSFDSTVSYIKNPETLSKVYEFYSVYHHRRRDKNRFAKNLNNFKKLVARSRKLKINDKDKIKIHIRYKYSEALGYQFLMRNEKSYSLALKNLYECLTLSKKINSISEILKYYFIIGNLELENSNSSIAEKLYTQGLKLALKNDLKTETILFKTKINNLIFQKDNSKADLILKETLKYYKDLPVTVYSDYRLHILFHLLRFSSFSEDKKLFKYLSLSLVNELLIYSRFADAFFRFYALKTDEYIDNLISWNTDGDNIILEINPSVLKSFIRFNYNSIFSLRKLYSNDQLFFVYITQVELEFWKWENADLENAIFFVNKIDRILRKNHTFSNVDYFNTLKFCISILEKSKFMSDKNLVKTYLPELIKIINNIKSIERNFNIIYDFTILVYLSQKLNNIHFTKEINKLYKWIKNKKPEIISRMLSPAYAISA
ncbi:MAG TPA: hypothetical protein PLG90_00930 [Ignavibacteria bacterium]|nr:hypothetical protein [Ignavibacteria bacterium]